MYANVYEYVRKRTLFKILFLSNILIINKLNFWHEVRNVLNQVKKILSKNLLQ